MKNNLISQTLGLSLLAGVALSVSQAAAATMTYTATGGLISGTINGTPFANATWSITATGDTADIQPGLLSIFSASVPFFALPVDPVLTIDDGNSPPWVATLLDDLAYTWYVGSLGYSTAGAPYDLDGFMLYDGTNASHGAGIVLSSGYVNLETEESLFGDSTFADMPFLTSIGELAVDNGGDGPGTFTITAVPETSTVIPTMTLIAGGLLLRRRSGRRFGGH